MIGSPIPRRTFSTRTTRSSKPARRDASIPALAFDDTDYDLAEVTSTLNLPKDIKGEEATVVATFKVLKQPHRIEWKLKMIGGGWKIADIVSMSGDWALSQFNCE